MCLPHTRTHAPSLPRFNEARTRKPQTFRADAAGVVDPTDGGRRCDFCNWQELTAEVRRGGPWAGGGIARERGLGVEGLGGCTVDTSSN